MTHSTATTLEAQLAHGSIRYRESGPVDGPPIVFVHGLLVSGDLWRDVWPSLAERGYRCIVPDWPLGSHVAPMRPEADLTPPGLANLVGSFLEALELDDVTLVGNDTGGAICQIVVADRPERVGRLVLTNCDAFENFLPLVLRYVQIGARIPGFIGLMSGILRVRALHRLPIAFGWVTKRPIPRPVIDAYLAPIMSNVEVRRDLAKALRGISTRHTRAAAGKFHTFNKPVLLVWASEDKLFPVRDANRLQALFPNARLDTVADSYAFIPEDQPARLVQSILSFLDATPTRAGRDVTVASTA